MPSGGGPRRPTTNCPFDPAVPAHGTRHTLAARRCAPAPIVHVHQGIRRTSRGPLRRWTAFLRRWAGRVERADDCFHPALLNGLFASVQLALGFGLLFRRTARLAIVASIAWAAGVWYLGEGMGGLAGGTSSALNGAPGAAVLYLVLALAAWPESLDVGDGLKPPPHLRPPRWLLVVWAVLWVGFAGLNLLPTNVPPHVTSWQLTANAAMVPPWLAAIDRWMASVVTASGYGAVTVIIALELCIGVLVFGNRVCRDVALGAGTLVAGLFWAVGQSFGQLFSGQGNRPEYRSVNYPHRTRRTRCGSNQRTRAF